MTTLFPLRSRFEASAVAATGASAILAALSSAWWALPPLLFLALCLAGSFIQRLNFYLPIARRGDGSRREVSLTFDDGPDPATTPLLLDLLHRAEIRAAFFVVGRKASDHPHLIREILENGHEVANHSNSHDVFLMLKGRKTIEREISNCQDRLARFSIRPRAFRPPAGVTNPHLRPVLAKLGLDCIGFSCRPLDFGNRRIAGIGDKVLLRIRPGDILLLHDCTPHGGATPAQWLEEVKTILEGLPQKDLKAVALSRLLDRPVMEKTGGAV